MAIGLQRLLGIALLSSAVNVVACSSADLSKIHERMTDDELFSIFKVKNRTAVPDYELVPIFHRESTREGHGAPRSIWPSIKEMHFTVSRGAVKLYLEPLDHLLLGENTPVYVASGSKAHPHAVRYERVREAWPSNFSMYQDLSNNAAVAMFTEPNGKVHFEGTVGDNLVIKPMPFRFQDTFLSFNDNEYDASHHFVYKKQPWSLSSIFDEESDQGRFFNLISKRYHTAQPSPPKVEGKVDIVYPEVLVIVDHETYLQHGKNVQALCKYMAAFWNAVDLRFRGMSEPIVRLNIAGLIVPSDKYGAPYMEYHRVGKHYLRTMETHEDIGRYLYKDDRLAKSSYDFAVAITNLNLCLTKDNGCDPSSLGVAKIEGACDHNENESDVAVALLEDAGAFDGILTAAHEIGHLLGSVHDGESSYLGPGALDCGWDDGYLMSSTRETSNGFQWSRCSIEQMRYFLRRGGECLRNKPVVDKPYPKILPGQLLSRDEQCKILNGMVECKVAENECGALWCKKPGHTFNYRCVSTRAPAEGSSCIGGGICLDGKCVHKVEENNGVAERKTAVTLLGWS
ncbi:A disintegrin and metalloproteinase with thrombospondin motifs like [Phymastichus coffea]|uniref:A disintegrin and metalloproteinase with thrombospondin motifs like n=1 Tax=Phymastichus coffea TaxID=108790 RepID=UPI00273C0BC5|nr:A disintegrin and metalloproteinase with thrombospondin motifs like [Phymastichus coffea]